MSTRFGEPALRAAAIAVLLPAAGAISAQTPAQVQRQHYAMGTMFAIVVCHASAAAAERAALAALDEVVRLDGVLSHYKEQSDLSRLNREGRRGFVAVEPGLYEVVERSLDVSRRSGGRFDVTIAPLLRVWRAAFEAGREPSAEEVARARRCVGYQHVEIEPPDRIRFRSDCLELDLGGIGKGYAVDRAIGVLRAAGVRDAVVNAGGSTIGAMGTRPGGDGWPVGLGGDEAGQRVLWLRDEAVSTSQQHVRRLPFGPGAFGEIIDPRRAAPLPHEDVVSVIAPSATTADALSTTLLLMPAQDGKAVLAQFPRAAALWMTPAGRVADTFRSSRLRLAHAE